MIEQKKADKDNDLKFLFTTEIMMVIATYKIEKNEIKHTHQQK